MNTVNPVFEAALLIDAAPQVLNFTILQTFGGVKFIIT